VLRGRTTRRKSPSQVRTTCNTAGAGRLHKEPAFVSSAAGQTQANKPKNLNHESPPPETACPTRIQRSQKHQSPAAHPGPTASSSRSSPPHRKHPSHPSTANHICGKHR